MTMVEEALAWGVKFLIGCIIGLISWQIKTMKKEVSDLQRDIRHLEVELPTVYFSKEDFKRFEDRLFARLDHLYDKLESKVDKP